MGGLAAAIVLLLLLSRFFPIVDLVETIQQRVVRWGVGGAVCYPFLFAGCNVLLLPGGILCVGAGFFFGLWWGFFIVFTGNVKSPQFVVHQLIDIVSKNGNLLLNIGPRSDGTIPEEVQEVLRDVGAWLKTNGDATMALDPGKYTAKAPDRKSTR